MTAGRRLEKGMRVQVRKAGGGQCGERGRTHWQEAEGACRRGGPGGSATGRFHVNKEVLFIGVKVLFIDGEVLFMCERARARDERDRGT
jgi:hypothetical protein